MSVTIPFVARGEASAWVDALSAALPGVRIVPFRGTTAQERSEATVALAANPDPAELAALPNLVFVQSLWAGVERMLAELPETLPIARLVDPQLALTMAEGVLAFTLYLHRDMPHYAAAQRDKSWRPGPMRLARDTPVGILGLGELGRASAEALQREGFPVLGWSRSEKTIPGVESHCGDDGLKTVLGKSAIIVVLLPMTPDTRGILGREAFDAMTPGTGLINFARGPLIDTPALLDALDKKQVSHAVLDVFDVEPLPEESPYWTHPDVTVLPHISAPTHKGTASAIAAANIRAFLDSGTLPPVVDRRRGY
ncbi:2-hydroxyacid dehydrogenase [Acuticoccus kandeliae]|uniref:2-hydroxyacid dehydrogenase n=1 Tax=Acuticoccus kandeliae TaxID=2073160 RepID=UPI000D3EA2E9|nr:glyoxylate/hydroxypyruvate reductase A [Acuticoccus kandeliae]